MPLWHLLRRLSSMLSRYTVGDAYMLDTGGERTVLEVGAPLPQFCPGGKLLGSGTDMQDRDAAGHQARHMHTHLSPAWGSVPLDQ